jgi:hypothetical protein
MLSGKLNTAPLLSFSDIGVMISGALYDWIVTTTFPMGCVVSSPANAETL